MKNIGYASLLLTVLLLCGTTQAAVPVLESNPAAPCKLYLDFDGHTEAQWGGYTNVVTPAFDTDRKPADFTAETPAITEMWGRVSEDFAPFNIDVTTVEPAEFGVGKALRVCVGGDGAWSGINAAGLAFTGQPGLTVYQFPRRRANDPKKCAESISHETGHAFGLRHQAVWRGTTRVTEYDAGPKGGEVAPIMGNSYAKPYSRWSNGTTFSATTFQDCLAVIGRPVNGFGFVADDFPGVTQFSGSVRGLIGTADDTDVFEFETEGGPLSFTCNAAPHGPNLDVVLELRCKTHRAVVARADPSNSINATLAADVIADTYQLIVSGTGAYGVVGRYTLTRE